MKCLGCGIQLDPMATKCYNCGFDYKKYNEAVIQDGY